MAKRIYVGNLPWSTTSADLEALFREYGTVTSAEVITDRATGRSRGFGFVEMGSDSESDAAINALNEKDVQGRTLIVNEARDRMPRSAGSGGRDRGDGGGYRDSRY